MAKYLDYAGLQYLWAKIKNYVSTQPLGANVRYDQQTLTTAQQAQARKNIAAANTNPNLLDNPWWGSGEVVNQRGVTAQPSSNGTYCIDRWVWTTGATANTMSLTANGLAFTIASSSVWFAQRGVYAKILSGKTYTASVMLSDGTIKSGTGTVNTGTQTTFYTDSQLTLYLSTDGTFTCTVRATQTIRAVKLELGSVSTLANDAPPDYGEELTRCIYSTVDLTDIHANNGFGRSNRNLLDNPWFTAGNVVNQKEFSSMASVSGYTRIVDRWLVNSSGATLSSDGITIEPTGNDYGLLQRMERSRLIANETYTLSVVINGTLYTRTFVWNSNKYFTNFYGTVRAYMGSPNDNPLALWIVGRPGDSFTISKIKLELGSVSTLANDAPPDYGMELLKCMRYFIRYKTPGSVGGLGFAYAHSTTNATAILPLPCVMRTSPTITVSGEGLAIQQGTVRYNLTAPTGAVLIGNALLFTSPYTVSSGVATAGQVGGLLLRSNSTVDLSADL